MKLTIDCEWNAEAFAPNDFNAQDDNALLALLAKARITRLDQPLEGLISQQFGLVEDPDYPIAAVAGSVEGLQTHQGYWLRASPVHLVLQRDCLSLGEPIPLKVEAKHAANLIQFVRQ